MCFLRQCCTHSLCPTLWPLCPKTGSVLAMQFFLQKSWLDCGKSLLHTRLGSHHVFFAAMMHSQFVPHSVVTMLQNWLGLGHAAFVQKSWLDCGTIIIAHKTGVSPCVFCGNAALTVCAPHCGHCAPKLARSWPCSLCAEVMVGLW